MTTWTTYEIGIDFDDRVVGGIPVLPAGADRADAYEKWARGQGVEQPDARGLAETLAEDLEMPTLTAEDEVAGMVTGFRRDDEGIYLEARQVKAMLRESAQRLGIIKKVRGSRQVLQHDIIVRGADGSKKLRLVRDGFELTEPDGGDQRPIAVITPQGPRSAIKRFEYVNQASMKFTVRVLAGGIGDGLIDADKLGEMVEFAGESLGLGADRSQDEGTFTVTQFEQV